MKKLTILLFALLLCCFALFVSCDKKDKPHASSEDVSPEVTDSITDPTDKSYFTFTLLDDGTYSIKAKDVHNMPATVVLPAMFNGKAVTSIDNFAFRYCSSLTSITIPDSVTSIDNSAFRDCFNLMSITIPHSVTSIGVAAFQNCSKLASITIPDSVTSIDNSAFSDCVNLTSITIPDSVTSIGYYGTFYNCCDLTSITLPDSITSIGGSAFYGCTSLTSITIPDSVTSIGGYAFMGCSGIIQTENGISYVDNWVVGCQTNATNVVLRKDTIGISAFAFEGCSNLISITIPDSVISIGEQAFFGCADLKNVYYTGTVEDWTNTSIDPDSDLTHATRYYYSETQPTEAGSYWHYVDGVPTAW